MTKAIDQNTLKELLLQVVLLVVFFLYGVIALKAMDTFGNQSKQILA